MRTSAEEIVSKASIIIRCESSVDTEAIENVARTHEQRIATINIIGVVNMTTFVALITDARVAVFLGFVEILLDSQVDCAEFSCVLIAQWDSTHRLVKARIHPGDAPLARKDVAYVVPRREDRDEAAFPAAFPRASPVALAREPGLTS